MEEALRRIKEDGENFDKVAREFSEDKAKQGRPSHFKPKFSSGVLIPIYRRSSGRDDQGPTCKGVCRSRMGLRTEYGRQAGYWSSQDGTWLPLDYGRKVITHRHISLYSHMAVLLSSSQRYQSSLQDTVVGGLTKDFLRPDAHFDPRA